jgi:hypothetical protein
MQHELPADREAERQILIGRVAAAFAYVQLGDGVSLNQARCMDDYASPSAIAAARELDEERSWQEISDEKVDLLGDTLAFMDAEGFRFYFPRFMTFALLETNPSSFAHGSAVWFSNMAERAGKHLDLLNDEQRSVVRDFAAFHAAEM